MYFYHQIVHYLLAYFAPESLAYFHRNNHMFAGSHEAAQRAAMMYSFFGSCKKNDINPLDWLTKVLSRIPDHSIQHLEELLPKNLH